MVAEGQDWWASTFSMTATKNRSLQSDLDEDSFLSVALGSCLFCQEKKQKKILALLVLSSSSVICAIFENMIKDCWGKKIFCEMDIFLSFVKKNCFWFTIFLEGKDPAP